MSFTLTVTSQGQVSIPAKLRKLWNLTGGKQITLTLKNEKVAVIEPAIDILEHVKTIEERPSINKGLTLGQIALKEKQAIEEGYLNHYLKKEKRSKDKILTI